MILADGVVANIAAFRSIKMKKWQIKLWVWVYTI